ncbi:unnamed protein product [Phaedon cochleariae]|uniref:Uncharacterized protein n=1 Tax=Phaedon cochleariae TaxID=80249 RepID=A0A9N9SJR4_PHACE|nr:unnamed protein product [Phaedon cochleariae]
MDSDRIVSSLVNAAVSAADAGSSDDDFEDILTNTRRSFRRPISGAGPGRRKNNTVKKATFLLRRSNADFLPTSSELKYLTDNGFEVDSETTIRFSPIQPISTSGLYTVEEINKAQRSLTFGVERQAVENIITRRVAGFEVSNQGYSTLNIFEPAEMEKLAKSTLRKIWGWFTDVGIFFSGVMGIYMIFKCIQYFVGIILNGVHLYKIFGWSLALIASIWNTLTMWQKDGMIFTRSWSIEEVEEYICTRYSSVPLLLVGFRFAKALKSRQLQVLNGITNVEGLLAEMNQCHSGTRGRGRVNQSEQVISASRLSGNLPRGRRSRQSEYVNSTSRKVVGEHEDVFGDYNYGLDSSITVDVINNEIVIPTLQEDAEVVNINIKREHCVDELFVKYQDDTITEKKISVSFIDEIGVDGGGLTKELFN